jgi:alpha-L-fucosidase
MKKILPILFLTSALAVQATVQTQMLLRMGDDGISKNMRQPDSSGFKCDTCDNGYNPQNIVVSTNTAALAQSTNCYVFNGTGGLFFASLYYTPPTANFGVEAWVKAGTLTQSNKFILCSSANGAVLKFNGASGFTFVFNGTTIAHYVPASTNEWDSLALLDQGGTASMFVNGVMVGGASVSTPPQDAYYQWSLGCDSGGNNGFVGSVDEYRVFTFQANAFSTNDLSYVAALGKPTILSLPTWITATQEGTNITAVAGETINLKCVVKGAAPLTASWLFNGAALGVTTPTLTIPILTTNNSGLYQLLAINNAGSVTSAPVLVTVKNLVTLAPSTNATASQADLINRKYGMFIHFAPQTFDPSQPENYYYAPPSISIYNPASLNVNQWIQTAYNAGFRYVVITAKHSSGFCLWATATTTYCVTNSPVKDDIIAEAAAACARCGMRLGIYYSIGWDQTFYGANTGPLYGYPMKSGYFSVVTNQLTELLTRYGPICEIWFDGEWAWQRNAYTWHCAEIYDLVHRLQPNCNVVQNQGITQQGNWITTPPNGVSTNNGDFMLYCPQDVRAADPVLPNVPDPKLYANANLPYASYYLPYESPQTIQSSGNWFWHLTNDNPVSVWQITNSYNQCISQNDAYLINCPADTNGLIPAVYSNQLYLAAQALGISPIPPPVLITAPSTLAGGQFQFSFDTVTGVDYVVQYSTNLTQWFPWVTLEGIGVPLTLIDPNSVSSQQRFYRIIVSPQ